MGGGGLFQSLLAAGQVDTVELAVVPVLLGGGIPFLPGATTRTPLELTDTERYPSGVVALRYTVGRPAKRGKRTK
jgi:dihydrofolate reductase